MRDGLQKLPLFASVKVETIETLTRALPRRKFKSGEALIRQGGRDLIAYVLLEGKISVLAESAKGASTSLLILEAPYLIGEIELWQERPYLGTVVAIEPCTALALDKKAFLKLLHSSHQVCINLVQMLSSYLYESARDQRVHRFGRVEHVVADTLCAFARLYGEERQYGILVRKDINKTELAGMLGVARRSVIRALDALQKEKLIELDGKQLVIPDLGALQRKASSPFLAPESATRRSAKTQLQE